MASPKETKTSRTLEEAVQEAQKVGIGYVRLGDLGYGNGFFELAGEGILALKDIAAGQYGKKGRDTFLRAFIPNFDVAIEQRVEELRRMVATYPPMYDIFSGIDLGEEIRSEWDIERDWLNVLLEQLREGKEVILQLGSVELKDRRKGEVFSTEVQSIVLKRADE